MTILVARRITDQKNKVFVTSLQEKRCELELDQTDNNDKMLKLPVEKKFIQHEIHPK